MPPPSTEDESPSTWFHFISFHPPPLTFTRIVKKGRWNIHPFESTDILQIQMKLKSCKPILICWYLYLFGIDQIYQPSNISVSFYYQAFKLFFCLILTQKETIPSILLFKIQLPDIAGYEKGSMKWKRHKTSWCLGGSIFCLAILTS